MIKKMTPAAGRQEYKSPGANGDVETRLIVP
jgi:hypothetical protein